MAKLVIQHYLEKFKTIANTLTDISFDTLPFFVAKEPLYNMKGRKISKSYYDKNGKEAVRISYNYIFGNHTYENVTYENVFLGLKKTIHYLDWAGQIAYSKNLQPYYFDLQPVFNRVDENTVNITFSSQKQREILKSERYSADDYLQAQNPTLYALLYSRYSGHYDYYLKTGKKEALVSAMNSETDPTINAVFDNEVYGYEPMTVKELIIMNLQ